jgi:hypothetical protein
VRVRLPDREGSSRHPIALLLPVDARWNSASSERLKMEQRPLLRSMIDMLFQRFCSQLQGMSSYDRPAGRVPETKEPTQPDSVGDAQYIYYVEQFIFNN